MLRLALALSRTAMALLAFLGACASPDGSAAPIDEFSADVANAASLNICQATASELVRLTHNYTSDLRAVKRDCVDPGNCPALGVADASFSSISTTHASLMFACTPPATELCDGLDNDKDTQIDEDFPNKGSQCVAGVGACTRFGFLICDATGTGTTCSAVPGQPFTEFCGNNFDDDCDGVIDNGCGS